VLLVRPDLDVLEAAIDGDEALAAVMGVAVVPGWATFAGGLARARELLAADPSSAGWGTRFFVEQEELVGWGGFKGAPVAGAVEIGYEIAAARQGQGLATAAAAAMLDEALADEGVCRVLAHTLPERNASNHILEKLGFRWEGDMVERGRQVWRFAYAPG
jgi:RimJ/RimL family protein N-acetyltransferase